MIPKAESIVLVSSSDPSSTNFGTGFIIHHMSDVTYVSTSAHVVRDIGEHYLTVDGIPAKVIAASDPEDFDVAILEVSSLFNKPSLHLTTSGTEGNRITIPGFYRAAPSFTPQLRIVHGALCDQGMLTSKSGGDRTLIWHLRVDGEHLLQRGYSGSPVFDAGSNQVLGVVRTEENQGKKGTAISIGTLKKIWQDAPFEIEVQDLLSPSNSIVVVDKPIKVFLLFSEKDRKYKEKFEEICLNRLTGKNTIQVLSKDTISPGANRQLTFQKYLNDCTLAIVIITSNLVSSYYKNTDNIRFHIDELLQHQKNGQSKVIPVLIRLCKWEDIFVDIQPLPRNEKFVTDKKSWNDQDSAFFNISEELEQEVKSLIT